MVPHPSQRAEAGSGPGEQEEYRERRSGAPGVLWVTPSQAADACL